MAFVVEELITDIRGELGCVPTCELTDEQITSAIDCTVRVYSKAQPNLRDEQVTVPVSGILGAASDVVLIFATSYSHRSSFTNGGAGGDFLGFGFSGSTLGLHGNSISSGINDFDINARAMEIWYSEYISNRSSENVPIEVRLIGSNYEFNPAPSSPEEGVWLRLGVLQTASTFPNQHYEILKDGATNRAGRTLALARHKFKETGFGDQKMIFRDPTSLLKHFNDEWKEWKRALGQARHTRVT